MELITRIADKTGALGTVVSAMGCAACFPAIASVGPAIVLAAMLLFFGNWWTANLLYVGLAFMVGVSIWDLVSPANRRCEPDGCALPPQRG